MPVQATQQNNKLVFTFEPKMDNAACSKSEPLVAEQTATAGIPVVFDLTGVAFIASRFLRMALQAAKQCGPGNFSIVGVEPMIKLVLKTAGLDTLITDR